MGALKKVTVLLVAGVMIFTMSSCGNRSIDLSSLLTTELTTGSEIISDVPAINPDPNEGTESNTKTDIPANPSQNKSGFKQGATINETVLVDENGIKVIAKDLTYSKYAANLELILENNSDMDITLMSGTLGYGCNSVNGIMFSGGYFHSDVKAGKRAKENVSFKYEDLLFYGIDEIAEIELGIYSSPKDGEDIYYPVSQIKTSAAGSHIFDASVARNTINSSKMQSNKGYTVKYFAEEKLYDVDDVSIVSEILFENSDGNMTLLIETVNNSAYQSRIAIEDITINGINVCSSRWTSELINPGKTAFIDIELDSVFDKQYWEMFGITDIKSIKLGIEQSDRDGEYESSPETIVIPVSGGESSVDTSGVVAYNEDGVKVIYKGIVGGKYDYDGSLYLMLLVENTSGWKIHIDADNVSVNDFMVDTIVFGEYIEDGDCVVLEIKIYEWSLEDCDVKEASDIADVEFTVEIRDENWSNKKEGVASFKTK